MGFLQRVIETRLSAALNCPVRFENLKVSLLSGSIEATNMEISGRGDDSASSPLLRVRRIRAEISIPRAMKKEIVIKSLAIDGAALAIARKSDGSTNLPGKPQSVTPPPRRDSLAGDDEPNAFAFEAARVDLRDSSVRIEVATRAGEYRASFEKLSGDATMANGLLLVTLQAASVGRRDVPVELGPAQLAMRLEGVENLAYFAPSAIRGTATVGSSGREAELIFESTAPARGKVQSELHGFFDMAQLVALSPTGRLSLPGFASANVTGAATLTIKATLDLLKGFRIAELDVSASSVEMNLSPADSSRPPPRI